MEIIHRELKPIDLFTDQELIEASGKVLVWDIECYSNYFLVAFKCIETGKVIYFELSPDSNVHIQKLMWVMRSFLLVGFNSIKFDTPLAWLAISGANTNTIKSASDSLIKFGKRVSDLEVEYVFKIQEGNHIDLIEVAPLKGSLKVYAARLHASRLQDLPYDPDKYLTQEEALNVRHYCINDLDCTALLYKKLLPQISLREKMSQEYKHDLRSKSDAQIAEAVLSNEIATLKGYRARRPKIEPGAIVKYRMPDCIGYTSKVLQDVQEKVRNSEFMVKENGHVQIPASLDNFAVQVGGSIYRMGIGGLHSSEENISYKSDKNTLLIDRDVASYYPRIILNQRLCPKHLGKEFLDVYETIVNRRLEGKRNGDEVTAEGLKITINGSFGKLSSKYSILYSPDLMIQVTLTGQLALLMLIEQIELSDIPVVSGNTDGIVIKCPINRYEELNQIVATWESKTAFKTEETRYKAVYCHNVNNYLALKEDGKFKLKGSYAEASLSKNPVNLVCIKAVKDLISNNIPIEDTIRTCEDIRQFITVRKVKGGAVKDNVYLGKVIRWYYAKKETGTINYKISGNKVARSEGARPLMDLPDSLPKNIDYQWYIDEANSILKEIDFYHSPKPKQLKFF